MSIKPRKVGLIGAMDEEIRLILGEMEHTKVTFKAGIHFYEGFFLFTEMVLCKSGVGKVNAAICTQILIDRFTVDAIVFTGVAGALHPLLEIGDIVISTDCMHHDMDVTALGFALGTIPYESLSVFEADRDLIDLAYEAGLGLHEGHILKGRILSGDQFIADRDKVHSLYSNLEGCCTEMEGAAVAQVCAKNEVPFVIIRSMSDKAAGSADVNFAQFTETASRRSFQIVKQMMEAFK